MEFFKKIKKITGTDVDPRDPDEDIEIDGGLGQILRTYPGKDEIEPVDDYNENPIERGEEREMTNTNFFPVIRKPREFDDCKTIAMDIKENKMVTVNIEELDSGTAQDLMDFLAGAMSITGAKFIKINKTVYTIVPAGVNVQYDGKNDDGEKTILDIKY